MGKLNRTCLTCQSQYYYCFSCPSDLQHPSWKSAFDTENCKEIFNILSRHGQGKISNEEAKELLNKCDLTKKDTFAENIKNHINQIFGIEIVNEIKEEKIEEEVAEPVVEEIAVVNETVLEEVIEEVSETNLEETTENTGTILPKFKKSNKKYRK